MQRCGGLKPRLLPAPPQLRCRGEPGGGGGAHGAERALHQAGVSADQLRLLRCHQHLVVGWGSGPWSCFRSARRRHQGEFQGACKRGLSDLTGRWGEGRAPQDLPHAGRGAADPAGIRLSAKWSCTGSRHEMRATFQGVADAAYGQHFRSPPQHCGSSESRPPQRNRGSPAEANIAPRARTAGCGQRA